MDIRESTALVTGGASGLGEACVRNLIEAGARVAILDVAGEKGEAMARDFGKDALFCRTDVTDEQSVTEAIRKTSESFGTLHIAVNCAGIGIPEKVLGKEGLMDMERFRRVIEINLMGTMNVIRLSARQMITNKGDENGEKGVVVNTSSVAAFEGQIGQASYSASKAGIVGMTLPIAREFAEHGIRVMTLAPGIFDTPMLAGLPENVRESLGTMVPFPRRLGRPGEFAGLVRHVIENVMLNGEVIRLDGAIRMAAK